MSHCRTRCTRKSSDMSGCGSIGGRNARTGLCNECIMTPDSTRYISSLVSVPERLRDDTRVRARVSRRVLRRGKCCLVTDDAVSRLGDVATHDGDLCRRGGPGPGSSRLQPNVEAFPLVLPLRARVVGDYDTGSDKVAVAPTDPTAGPEAIAARGDTPPSADVRVSTLGSAEGPDRRSFSGRATCRPPAP